MTQPTVHTPIFVTGLGAVTPYGAGVDALWQALLRGAPAISDMDLFDLGGIACTQAGIVRNYTPPSGFETGPRASGFAAGACVEALRQAGLLGDPAALADTALITASNFGDIDTGEAALIPADQPGHAPSASRHCAHATPAATLAKTLGLGGLRIPLSLSCASGASAAATAANLISAGRASRVLVVGYDALSRFSWSGLCSLRTMTKDAVRPFDINRNGTIFTEGAAAFVLERSDLCAARGAVPLALLSGWASGNNGHHMTAPAPRGAGSEYVMRKALERARLTPEAVDHINVHGTGTKPNDTTETHAIQDLFGARSATIPVTSVKGLLGHMLGAAGSVELAVSVLSLNYGIIPPTGNLTNQDPECALDVATAPRTLSLKCVLSNSAGFGGCNAAVVLEKVQKSGVRSQESGVRSQESEVRSQESGVRSQESGVRSQKSGVRSQEPGVRSQESEARSQESGVRSQESGVRSQESEARSQESEARSQESGVRSQEEVLLQPETGSLQPPSPASVLITGVGVISALGADAEETVIALKEGESALFPLARFTLPEATEPPTVGEAPDPDLAFCGVSPKSYLDRASQLFLAACGMAFQRADLDAEKLAALQAGVMAGTAWGCMSTAELFFADYMLKGPRLVKPFLFPHAYSNTAVSLAAMEWSLKGPHENVAATTTASGVALVEAFDLIRAGQTQLIAAGGADALSATSLRERIAAGETAPAGEAAAMLILESGPSATGRGAAPLGHVLGCGMAGTPQAAADIALAQAGVSADALVSVYANTAAQQAAETIFASATVIVPDKLCGDVQGATTALHLAFALLAGLGGPTLILTAEANTCVAFIVSRP